MPRGKTKMPHRRRKPGWGTRPVSPRRFKSAASFKKFAKRARRAAARIRNPKRYRKAQGSAKRRRY